MPLGEIREVLELDAGRYAREDNTPKLRQIYTAQLSKLQQQYADIGSAISDLKDTIDKMATG